MKTRKNIFILGAAGLALTALTGCNETNSSSSESDSPIDSSGSSSSSSSETNSESSNGEFYVFLDWERNEAYVTYSSRKATTDSNFGSANFISSEGEFRIGTANAVSLLPVTTMMNVIDPSDIVTIDEMPEGSSVKIADQEGNELNLDDYFDSPAKEALLTKGEINFRDDIEEGKPLKVILTFVAPETSDVADLTYKVTIVPGAYNVTEAKELVLFDNYHGDESYLEMKREFLGEEATASTSFDDLIIFNDITIAKDDIPSCMIWSEADEQADPSVYGSLKDWEFIYEHEADPEGGLNQEFAIYGNYNTISLGEDFPYVVTEQRNGTAATLPGADETAISTHATLFGNDNSRTTETMSATYNFEDLGLYGNQGVGTSQIVDWKLTPDNPDDDTIGGGILFYKNTSNTVFKNCSIRHFFTVFVNTGAGNIKTLKQVSDRPTIDVVDTRMSDCFSSMLFNYSDTVINVNGSVLENAGGFLFIDQAIPTKADPTESDWGNLGDDIKYVKGSDIIIDAETKMQNWVTGDGGWFDVYNLGALFQSQIKPMISDPLNAAGKTLFKNVEGADRINCIGLMMNTNMESAGALQPGMRGIVKIGDTEYINPEGGKEEFEQALAAVMANPGNQAALANAISVLTSTNYGANFLMKYTTAGLMTDVGEKYFATPYTQDASTYTALPLETIVKQLAGIEVGSEDFVLDQEKFDGDYVTMFYQYGVKPSAPGSIKEVLADAASYEGSSGYQVIFGLNDFE